MAKPKFQPCWLGHTSLLECTSAAHDVKAMSKVAVSSHFWAFVSQHYSTDERLALKRATVTGDF